MDEMINPDAQLHHVYYQFCIMHIIDHGVVSPVHGKYVVDGLNGTEKDLLQC